MIIRIRTGLSVIESSFHIVVPTTILIGTLSFYSHYLWFSATVINIILTLVFNYAIMKSRLTILLSSGLVILGMGRFYTDGRTFPLWWLLSLGNIS
jgi:hypothetical protein